MILREALRAIGVTAMGDPPPSAGQTVSLSGSRSSYGSAIKLVGSLGKSREATYRQVYLFNPWMYAGVNHIARGIGRLPLHTYQLDGNAEKVRIRSDVPQTPGRPSLAARLDQILTRPSGRLSRQAFYGSTMRDRLIFGNGLWEIGRDGGGPPDGLSRIPWARVMHIEDDADGNPLWYEIAPAPGVVGKRRKVMAIDAVHFGLGADSEGCWNTSLIESCQHTIALHEAIMRHLMAYMENSMRSSGMFQAETAKAAKEARQLITELYTSPENAGKVLVTNAKWQSMSDSPDHGQLVELIKESRVEIAAALQVPPPTLGLLDNAIRANVKEMREQFGRDTIGPWASEFEGEISSQLINPGPSAWAYLFSEFQMGEMLRPDLEARALVYQRLMWVYSIDEIRSMENKEPLRIKGVTDVPWVASGAMPVTTAAKGKQPPASGASAMHDLMQISGLLERRDQLEQGSRNGHHHEIGVT